MTKPLLLLSMMAFFASPAAPAQAQQAAAPPPQTLCVFNSERIFAKYPGLDSSPNSVLSQWAVPHLRQALASRGCAGVVTDGSPATDVTDDILSRLDFDHSRAFETLKPLLAKADTDSVIGLVDQVGLCELHRRYVYARRPDVPYADGRTYVIRLNEITGIELSGRGPRFAVFGFAGQHYTNFELESEAETRTYATALAALSAPCMARRSAG